MALAVALRAPWFATPLGNDEGGLAYIAEHASGGGPNLFGQHFLDRPPLLVGAFRIAAETGGTAAVRTLGALAAALLVIVVALLARELGGRRPAIWAAFITAVLASSPALQSVYTPAELLAVVPSAASVLLLLIAWRTSRGRLVALALSGFLAIAALLTKQSFGDALLAGLAFLAATYLLAGDRAGWLRGAAAYLGGVGAALLCLEIWELAYGIPDGAAAYALAGFRVDGLGALAGSADGLLGRLTDRLVVPAVASGLLLVWVCSPFGMRRLRQRRLVQITVAAWAAGAAAGILLGGSYWPHYLIEAIPVSAVTAALALAAASPRKLRLAAAALAAVAASAVTIGPTVSQAADHEKATAIGEYVAARAHRQDTVYVRYSQPNILYYSGLRNPYPYNWSLMLRAIPDAQRRLRRLLEGPRAPTWVVAWERASAYDLDASGATARLLRRRYRAVAVVCGVRVLLRSGVRRPAPGERFADCS